MNCCFQQVLRKFRDEVSKKIKNLPCDEVLDSTAGLRDAPSSQLLSPELPAPAATPLFKHFFELRTEHCPIVTIESDMKPVAFFALDDEFCRVGKIWSPWSVLPGLRDYIDHQVPRSRL